MRHFGFCAVVAGISLAALVGERARAAGPPNLLPTPAASSAAPPPRMMTSRQATVSRLQRLPPVDRPIHRVHFVEPARAAVDLESPRPGPTVPEEVARGIPDEGNACLIDLPTALRLADANNLLVAAAREQIAVASARVDAANVLWLPSLRGGTNYNRHDGAIQDVRGIQFNTTRGALYAGAGAGIYGAGTPIIPGIYANFHLVDALFQPLAARQFAASRNQAAAAETNDTLLQVTLIYFELLRAGEDLVISEAARSDAQDLADLTRAYAETGAGLPSDANRALTELALRRVDVERSRESQRVASARLSELLRLDPAVSLAPADPMIVPIDLLPAEAPLRELVAQGLTLRPELAEYQQLVAEAVTRMRREKLAVFVPSFILGASYGGMGAGVNTNWAAFQDRFDFDAVAYWEMRNLGFGEAAARRGAAATVRATRYRYLAVMDQVAREVVEAHTQVQSRRAQMAIARLGVAAAVESHQQNLERIEHAKGLPIEVLQSIQALAQARRDYLRTVIDYNAAQFTLYRALGWPAKMPHELTAVAES